MTGEPIVTVETPAKVNLTLEVLHKRADGYHEIASVMQAVSLFDSLKLSMAEEVQLVTDLPELGTQDNLVYRAARLLKETTGVSRGAEIKLRKSIPVAAGLGGGSSDAAATLLGLNRLWGLNLGNDELQALAARLGSDVPFFLGEGTALAQGRGERISTLPAPPTSWLVLLFYQNRLENKTAAAYKSLSSAGYTTGQHTYRLAELLKNGAVLHRNSLFNAFDEVAPSLFPGIEVAWKNLEIVSGTPAHLSGAGPTLFCLIDGPKYGERVVDECAKYGLDCRLVKTLTPREHPRFISDG